MTVEGTNDGEARNGGGAVVTLGTIRNNAASASEWRLRIGSMLSAITIGC
jgi:hypothetical protein